MHEIEALQPVKHDNKLILTSEQLANFYESDLDRIRQNFSRNKEHYIENKHYFCLKGAELRAFKRSVANCDEPLNIKFTPTLYLWTEKGAFLHAKSLNTEVAWQVYDLLIESYFRKEEPTLHGSELIATALVEATRFLEEKAKTITMLENKIDKLEPLAEYTQEVLESREAIPASVIAEEYDMPVGQFNQMLNKYKVQHKVRHTWVLYANHMEKGYTASKTISYLEFGLYPKSRIITHWTQKGRYFIYLTLKKHGILPVSERKNTIMF